MVDSGGSLRCFGHRPSAAPAVTKVPDAAADPSSRCFRSASSLCCLLAGRARTRRLGQITTTLSRAGALSEDALIGFTRLYKRLIKDRVLKNGETEIGERVRDCTTLFDTKLADLNAGFNFDAQDVKGAKALAKSLEDYKVRSEANGFDGKFLFHQVDEVYDNLYHYMPEGDFKFVTAQGNGQFLKDSPPSGSYVSPDLINDSLSAKSKLQLKSREGLPDSERARYRVKFSTQPLAGEKLEVPNAYDLNQDRVLPNKEPRVKDNPDHGIGGARQIVLSRDLQVQEIFDLVEGRALTEAEIFNLIQKNL